MTAVHNTLPPLRPNPSMLVATPNKELRSRLAESLGKFTCVLEANTGAEALYVLEKRGARIVILDRNLPDLNSDELIGVVEQQFPGTDVLLLDGESGHVELTDDLRGNTAYKWLCEFNGNAMPCTPVLRATCSTECHMPLPGMVGCSEVIQQLAETVRIVAKHETAVLITGETGAGKELIAEAIHKLSSRADRPFVTVNCAAIPEALVEAELFGHTRGAFTGAVQARLGKIHAAHGGTIFFDEIGELPIVSQSKLLRFLESGEVQRLGTGDVFKLDVRVVAATNADLEKRVKEGLFREDLYYRLSVFPIELPSLRERREDIPLLARHFLMRFSGTMTTEISDEAEAILDAHEWPGNVRELRNVMERAFVLADGSKVITPEHILLRKPVRSVRKLSATS